MLLGQRHDLLERRLGVHRTRGVVGVDDHDALGARGDLRFHVLQVGLPAGFLVAEVVHGLAAGQGHRGCPQRVVGSGDEDLVAGIQQRHEGHRDEFADAVAQVDVIDVDILDPARLVVLRDGGAGGENAAGVAVALGVRQVADHVHQDRVRRFEPEGGRVSDVQFEDAVTLCLHLLGGLKNRSTDVVKDIMKLGGLLEFCHSSNMPYGGCTSVETCLTVRSPAGLTRRSDRRGRPRTAANARRLPALPGRRSPAAAVAVRPSRDRREAQSRAWCLLDDVPCP